MGESNLFWKNLLWQILGLILFIFLFFRFDYRKISLEMLWLLYGLWLLLFVILAFFKKRWVIIGPLSFQPSEFLKVILVYLLSVFIAKKGTLNIEKKEIPFLLAVIGLPLLFLLPTDLDYSFIIGVMFFTFLLMLGFPKRILFGLLGLGLIFILIVAPIAWSKLKPHQKGRLYGYLDSEKYALTWGYQLNQSLMAIGSGGILGQGFKKGWSTRLNFLPAKNTDLAFAVWAEAFGLLGSIIFLLAYGYIIYWGLENSRKAKDLIGKALSMGIVNIFLWQAFFNIGGAIGLLPMTSIPLPFLSYGGSITIITYLMLSLLFNIAFRRYFFK